jgi:vacuolar protein sorting-associated protein 13A/C
LKLTKRQYVFVSETLNAVSSLLQTPPSGNVVIDNDDGQYGGVKVDSRSDQQLSDLFVSVPCISLELYDDTDKESDPDDHSLAQFSLNGVTYKSAGYANGDSSAELSLNSINMLDTRKNGRNLFREIIPPLLNDDTQFTLRINRYANTGFSEYIAYLDTLKLLFVIDHLYLVRDFFLKPLANASGAEHTEEVSGNSPSDIITEPSIRFKVSVIDVEIVLLQDPMVHDCEAIVLIGKEITYAYEKVTTISMLDVGMFFCTMDSRNDTTVRFIQNFTVTVAMDNRVTGPGHKLTSVNIDISPLLLRVSYHDVFVINDIWRRLTTEETSGKNSGVENISDTSEQSNGDEIVMAREKVRFI